MRMYKNARLLAAMSVAAMAMAVKPDEDRVDVRREDRPEPVPEKPKNLPGETNRQFAARMATASPSSS